MFRYVRKIKDGFFQRKCKEKGFTVKLHDKEI